MTPWHFFSILVGLCILMQGVLNRQFSLTYGLAMATFVNALVFAVLGFGLFVVAQKFPLSFPEFLPPKLSHFEFKAWHIIPGICGFMIVVLTPWGIHHLGAAQVFILIVSSQIFFGFLWDYFVNSIQFSVVKIFGLVLVILGSIVFNWSK